MFKFNFAQILDYPLDLDDDMVTEEEDIIITPRGEHPNRETRPQDVCEEVSFDDLVCIPFSHIVINLQPHLHSRDLDQNAILDNFIHTSYHYTQKRSKQFSPKWQTLHHHPASGPV